MVLVGGLDYYHLPYCTVTIGIFSISLNISYNIVMRSSEIPMNNDRAELSQEDEVRPAEETSRLAVEDVLERRLREGGAERRSDAEEAKKMADFYRTLNSPADIMSIAEKKKRMQEIRDEALGTVGTERAPIEPIISGGELTPAKEEEKEEDGLKKITMARKNYPL
ncbi:MAG: hypothetical protein V1856_00735 [Candidatus Liptonbacteria bacterium]